ncbi:recombinase family protein [Streptomyces sp. NPDC057307]|uniref:recombinase family protein n=1 Tax=Streptomyces sp. NPDC057307 TaxID=3346096 RepID=UPI00362E98B2
MMNPLIFGYLHIESGQSPDETFRQERALKGYAEREGFSLATIYRDVGSGSRSGFAALVEELARTETRHVVVPAMGHLQEVPTEGEFEVHAIKTNPARPLAYGYLRVLTDADDRRAVALEQNMKRFAAAQGLQLTAIYHEFDSGSIDAFNELVEVLRLTGARDVFVPSLEHLAENDPLQRALLDRLECGFSTTVHSLDELPHQQDDTTVTSASRE